MQVYVRTQKSEADYHVAQKRAEQSRADYDYITVLTSCSQRRGERYGAGAAAGATAS